MLAHLCLPKQNRIVSSLRFSAVALNAGGGRVQLGETAAPDDPDELADIARQFASTTGMVALGRDWWADRTARGYAFLIAGSLLRNDWRDLAGFPPDSPDPAFLLVRFSRTWWDQAFAPLAEAFGLSRLEKGLARELADHGDLDEAATECALSHTSARNALVRLRTKFGSHGICEVVNHLLSMLAGPDEASRAPDGDFLADVLGLSRRHFAIVQRMADGVPRKRIVAETGFSMPVVKAVLNATFSRLSVESAGELACLIGQAHLVSEAFVTAEQVERSKAASRVERSLADDAGRQIGYTIQGQPDGPVALQLHSQNTCRFPPSRLSQALVREGWRVLSVDRPGFGDTDSAPAEGIDAHVAAAAADLALVAARENIDSMVIVARASGQMAIALKNALGPLISRGVLVNPAPAIAFTPVDRGPMGAVKRRFAANPASIRMLISVMLRLSTPQRLRNAFRRTASHSPPDLAGMDDPVMMADYLAAATPLSGNLDGYVVENAAWVNGWEPRPKFDARGWALIFGRTFLFHDPEISRAYFRKVLPGAATRIIEDGGQMLVYTHVDELKEAISAGGGS